MNAFLAHRENLLQEVGTNPETGLTTQQVKENRERFGANSFTKEAPPSLIKRTLVAFLEPMSLLLLIAAFLTVGINLARYIGGGEYNVWECIGIFVAIFLSVVITVVMESRSEKSFELLNRMDEDTPVKVLRDGKVQLIARKEVVAGDILQVETGDKIPADGRLLESVSLEANESALTGESAPVFKDAEVQFDSEKIPLAERVNMLYSGCFITSGHGKLLIVDVGDQTEFGKIAKDLSTQNKGTTPLQERMKRLGKQIAILGALAAVAVFIIQIVSYCLNGTFSMPRVTEAFLTSIVLIVAAVPEGLPTIVAVSLAINVMKMSKQNALVKKMIACETIGCINVICSDKTGTLTENRMTVMEICDGKKVMEPSVLQDQNLLENFCINSTANVDFATEQPKFIGSPTECALLVAAHRAGTAYATLRESAEILHAFPFSSETKVMTTVVKNQESTAVYTKGSPEKVLTFCSIAADALDAANQQIASYQRKAGRVIAFAHKKVEDRSLAKNREAMESEMIFDGFAVIKDPLRADVFQAVQHCRQAGIELKILTGDNLLTAKAIAENLSLLDDDHVAVEASELENLTDEQLKQRLPQILVIARSTPGLKLRVVKTLKAMHCVVAVTGDGINDAPAIKNADVGLAMGITGTAVSKEASDIVLLDDSFSTIVKAVQWGRGIYQNFKRFIQFQLTVNLSSVVVVLLCLLTGHAAPFTALELLWVNIIMDGPPALTLGLEPIRGDLMKERPVSRKANMISPTMFAGILGNGLFLSFVFLLQQWTNFIGGTSAQQSTILFTLFVIFQLFNAFNCRELGQESILRHFTDNRLMLGVFALVFVLQVIITEFGGMVFGTVPLPLTIWVKIIITAVSVLVFSEIVKLLKRVFSKNAQLTTD